MARGVLSEVTDFAYTHVRVEYPRGLHGDKISRYSQVLVVAELAAKAFDSNKQNVPWCKLEAILKLNFRQYGQGLIGHLNIFWENNAAEGNSRINGPEHLFAQVELIAELFDDFNHNSDHKRHDRITDLAQTRLAALRLELLETGFDPRDPAELIQRFIDDPECMTEYVPLLNEALWQFNSMVFEISRRCPEGVEETENPSNRPEPAMLLKALNKFVYGFDKCHTFNFMPIGCD